MDTITKRNNEKFITWSTIWCPLPRRAIIDACLMVASEKPICLLHLWPLVRLVRAVHVHCQHQSRWEQNSISFRKFSAASHLSSRFFSFYLPMSTAFLPPPCKHWCTNKCNPLIIEDYIAVDLEVLGQSIFDTLANNRTDCWQSSTESPVEWEKADELHLYMHIKETLILPLKRLVYFHFLYLKALHLQELDLATLLTFVAHLRAVWSPKKIWWRAHYPPKIHYHLQWFSPPRSSILLFSLVWDHREVASLTAFPELFSCG